MVHNLLPLVAVLNVVLVSYWMIAFANF